MNISPAIIIDVALIAVIVVSVFHYARKGFVAGLMPSSRAHERQ